MKHIIKPRAKLFSAPFINGYIDIEMENSGLTIGTSEELEDIFVANYPEYLTILCNFEYKTELPDITISAGYKITPEGEEKLMRYKIYDGKALPLDKIISEISIRFLDFLGNYNNLAWKNELLSAPIIYQKSFQTQTSSKRVDNFLDPNMPQDGIIHTKTKAHYFGGFYFKGINLSDIQPCLFFLGTGLQAKEYIKLITAKEALQDNVVKLDPQIEKHTLTTLKDDIADGKVKLRFQEQAYKSVMIINPNCG